MSWAAFGLSASGSADTVSRICFLGTRREGVFFYHFADKRQFSHVIAMRIRGNLKSCVGRIRADLDDPVERLAAGLIVAGGFALDNRKEAAILVRSLSGMSMDSHPANVDLLADIEKAHRAG